MAYISIFATKETKPNFVDVTAELPTSSLLTAAIISVIQIIDLILLFSKHSKFTILRANLTKLLNALMQLKILVNCSKLLCLL